MKEITISAKKCYSTFTEGLIELYTVALNGIEIDSFTTLEEAKHIAKGVGIGIQICGNKVSIKNEVPIKLA